MLLLLFLLLPLVLVLRQLIQTEIPDGQVPRQG
jgi:hypothetical protein